MRPIRLCSITTVPITLEKFVVPAMEYLAENGYDITLVCNMDNAFLQSYQNRFRCCHVPMARGVDPIGAIRATWRLYRLFRREQFDIVQYATPNAAAYAAIAAWLARIRARVYLQWGIRYVGCGGVARLAYRRVERMACRLSTHIRPASRKNLQFAVDEGLYPASKAKVVGEGGTIGVDFAVFDAGKKAEWRAEVRGKLNLGERTTFGYVGNIRRDKGSNELLMAFRAMHQRKKDVALVLVGTHFEQDSIDPELRAWSETCGAVYYCGRVSDPYRYLAAMDVLVHPSYREGFSMVIQEAAAMALPVITTDIPGPSEVIEDQVTGLLVPVHDAVALGKAMNRLADDPALRDRMGRAGLERDRRLFAREIMLHNTLVDRNKVLQETR